jgi:hypothetical protein
LPAPSIDKRASSARLTVQCSWSGSFPDDVTPRLVFDDKDDTFKLDANATQKGEDAPTFKCEASKAVCPEGGGRSRLEVLLEGSFWRMRVSAYAKRGPCYALACRAVLTAPQTNLQTSGQNAVDIWGPGARQVFEFPCGQELVMRFDLHKSGTKLQSGEPADEPIRTVEVSRLPSGRLRPPRPSRVK